MIRLFPKATLFDDAGRLRDVVRVRTLNRDARRSDPAFAQVVHRVSRTQLTGTSKSTMLLLIVLMGVGANLTHQFVLSGMPAFVSYLLWFLLTGGLVWLIQLGDCQSVARQIADALLSDGLCPACVYNLGGQPENKGLVVCPECGASWRATRIVHRHEFVAAPESEAAVVRRWWRQLGNGDRSGPTRIADDLSKEHAVVFARLSQPIHSATGERRARLLAARDEIRQHGLVGRVVRACLLLTLAGLATLIALRAGLSPVALNPMGLLFGLCMAGAAVFLPLTMLRGATGITAAHIRTAMLRRRLCPSCSGDLGNETEQPAKGLTTCPECGATWRLGE